MASITTRAGKGAPLTNAELDSNFTGLNDELATKTTAAQAAAAAPVQSVAGRTGAVTLAVADVSGAAPLASPALTGTPTAPTATVGTNTTQVATTAFVNAEIAADAPTKTGGGASGTWGISVTGNAATATKLGTARTISLTGDATGSASFDGSANASIAVTVADDSHNHVISNVDGLQTALDAKLPLSGGSVSGNLSVSGEFFAGSPAFGGFPLAPNLIHNSYMNRVTGGVPDGYSTLGAITIEAVHPFTKAFEGPYTATAPAGSVSDPELATQSTPYWFGVYQKGPRIARGGMADGWNAYGDGKILKVTGAGVTSGHCAIYLPKELNNLGARWIFSAFVKIVKGSVFTVGADAGYNRNNTGYSVSKATSDAGPQGWVRFATMLGTSQITSIDGLAISMAVLPDANGDIEGYIALPYLANVNYKGTNLDSWSGSVVDKLDRMGFYVNPNTLGDVRVANNQVIHSGNYNTYTPTLTGTGASGTWNIAIGGNAGTATKLATPRTISLSGGATGSASFDGSANANITVTVADDSHAHVISNVDGLQTALDAKAPLASPALTGTPTAPTAAVGTNTTQVATTAFVQAEIAADAVLLSGNQTIAGTKTFSSAISGSVTGSASRVAAIDDRDVKPNIVAGAGGKVLQSYFTSLEGMTGGVGTDYQDMLVLDTYSDASGGSMNALVLDKSTKVIRHYQAARSDTTWGAPLTLAYAENVPTLTGAGASGTWGISITGNAATADSAKNVASGTGISDLSAAWTLPGTSIANGFLVYNFQSTATNAHPGKINNANWLINIYSHGTGGVASYGHQISAGDTDDLYTRKVANGGFSTWRRLISDGNIGSFAPTLTGGGASGTWGISITGSAASATTAGNVTGTVAIANGGTGATNAASARTNLGLGTAATANTGTSGAAVPLLNTANTFSAAQTFRATDAVRVEAALNQDAIVLRGRAGGTGGFAAVLTPAALAATRIYTMPDAGGDASFVMTAGTQTLGGTYTFSNTITGSISGNAGTVTNGVYTTGDQTVAGAKTFSSQVKSTYTGAQGSWLSQDTNEAPFFATASQAADNYAPLVKMRRAKTSGDTTVSFGVITNPAGDNIDAAIQLIGSGDTPERRWYFLSSGDFTSPGNVTAYSDERLKTDWSEAVIGGHFIDALSKVKAGDYKRTDTGARQVGVSAQSLQGVIPNAVIEDDAGRLSVAYGNAAMVACVALAREVVELRRRVQELEDR